MVSLLMISVVPQLFLDLHLLIPLSLGIIVVPSVQHWLVPFRQQASKLDIMVFTTFEFHMLFLYQRSTVFNDYFLQS